MTKTTSSKKNSVKKATTTNKKKNMTKKITTAKKKSTVKAVSTLARKVISRKKLTKREMVVMVITIFMLGILLIFSTYAWFSTSINVKIKNFNMVVMRNSGLTISLDGINFDSFVEISEDSLINNLKKNYPTSVSQYAGVGLTPISSNGITDPNSYFFDLYASSGVRYATKKQENGFVKTFKMREDKSNSVNFFIAFDLFFKNETGSPVPDNLYLDDGTNIELDDPDSVTDEIPGLVNSMRIGFVKVGTVPTDTNPTAIQTMKCNNDCHSTIYEPNSRNHSPLSIERAAKYGIQLTDGVSFPTYACVKQGGPLYVEQNISGSSTIDTNYFSLQKTIPDGDFGEPLFSIPDGITKARVYVWIEGQDIDSLETNSKGADLNIIINFIKDTRGYTSFDE